MIQWSSRELKQLLLATGSEQRALHSAAGDVARATFGRRVYIRGLIEISNRCRNNCYYCGIRASNRDVERYSLDRQSILESCREGYALGFRTFVLQGGEDPAHTDGWLMGLVATLRGEFPDCAITLSLGERSFSNYRELFEAGANRYLLRHESYNRGLYGELHPAAMSYENRIRSLYELRRIGYQVGSGIMVGVPRQSIENIIEDIEFLANLQPEMIGIGPFIPHHATPFASEPAGGLDLTLNLLAVLRLQHPEALIPATTAIATLAPEGRWRAIEAGANVVMPNLTPAVRRLSYSLYDNKASFGQESAEGLRLLAEGLGVIGYEISYDRGDAPKCK